MKKEHVSDNNLENWIIFLGNVVDDVIKVKGNDNFFYNFKLNNGNFTINCVIAMSNEDKKLEESIFSTIKKDRKIKVSGNLCMKNKLGILRTQINVKNWLYTDSGNQKIKVKINV